MANRADKLYNLILKQVEVTLGNSTTYDSELLAFGKRGFGSKFHGVYPSDKIPRLTAKTPYAIVNLDTSSMPGSHWVALAYDKKNVYVYDSFGRPTEKIFKNSNLSKSNILNTLIDTENDAEQCVSEYNCGARCVAWLILFHVWGWKLALQI